MWYNTVVESSKAGAFFISAVGSQFHNSIIVGEAPSMIGILPPLDSTPTAQIPDRGGRFAMCREIELTKGKVAIVDDEDYELVSRYKWHCAGAGYARTMGDNRKPILMHSLIIDIPDGLTPDHINRNKLDNRKCNLRLANVYQQNANRGVSKNNKSGYKGVVQVRKSGSWLAKIYHRGKEIRLGTYGTPEDAARAYNEAAKEYFGEFAWLNDVSGPITTRIYKYRENKIIKCACGCGGELTQYSQHRYKRSFIHGHHNKVRSKQSRGE